MPLPTSKTKPLTLYPSHEVAERIEALAAAEHRSVSAQLLVLVERALKEANTGA